MATASLEAVRTSSRFFFGGLPPCVPLRTQHGMGEPLFLTRCGDIPIGRA